MKPAAVELRGVTKRFGGVLANDQVSLRVAAGTIHGIVGENGAGKSTAMKILYGLYRPDRGEILVKGRECEWRSPAEAITRGLGMVHQHFMLAGPYSVLENLMIGAAPTHFGFLDRKCARARLEEIARQDGMVLDWDHPVEALPLGTQQRIEILKLLYRDTDILILDEPTAVLTPPQTAQLFEHLKKLRARGKTILFVTHKLKEIMAITERVTVLRQGRVIEELETAATTPEELADLMVGRKVTLRLEVSSAATQSEPALEVTGLSLSRGVKTRPLLDNVNISVRRGEIVGLAGVEGNGQSELLEAVLHPAERLCRSAGIVRVLGQDVTRWAPSRIRSLGVGFIPEDRVSDGLLLERPVTENFLLGRQREPEFNRGGFLRKRKVTIACAAAIAEFDIRPPDTGLAAEGLSGGNQQKLILAREFERQPRLLIAAQPTRGVDAGAVEFIHRRLVRARDEGAGVLLVSSDLDEILTLSDRILVMFEGRVAGECKRGELSERDLGLKMGGA